MREEFVPITLNYRHYAAGREGASLSADGYAVARARMHRYAELTGLSLTCVEARTGVVLASTDGNELSFLPAEVLRLLPTVEGARVVALECGLSAALFSLPGADDAPVMAVGYAFADADLQPPELVLAAAEHNWPQWRLDEWRSKQLVCQHSVLESLVAMAVELEQRERNDSQRDVEFMQLSDELEQTYEEISLMHTLTRNLQISRGPAELAELCLMQMHELVRSAGNVIWIAEKDGTRHFLVRGELPFDELGMARLISHFEDHDWSRPLVRNNLANSSLADDFPGLQNLIIVPVSEGNCRFGWIVSCNLLTHREFGTIEASLISSVATILGTHVRNIHLYREHEELLLSFVRSLVSTLEAKDPYTRGHSERVALIGRRLGEELGLPADELRDIYVAGLLHDIGKIGVDDGIIRKSEMLTAEEFRRIREHPMIGYTILNGLKNLQRILPGVRNHHETYSGKGYPDGLAGEDIPLMARILAVADSYDAMKSDRPYRKGMPRAKIEAIFREGTNDQWDGEVIDAYFHAANDIERLCEAVPRSDDALLAKA